MSKIFSGIQLNIGYFYQFQFFKIMNNLDIDVFLKKILIS